MSLSQAYETARMFLSKGVCMKRHEVEGIIDAKYEECVQAVRSQLSVLLRFDTEGHAFPSTWEAVKYMVQVDRPFETYGLEEAVSALVDGVVSKLSSLEIRLMFLRTDAYFEQDGEDARGGEDPVRAVRLETQRRVLRLAADEPFHPSVQAEIDARDLDRFERDKEGHLRAEGSAPDQGRLFPRDEPPSPPGKPSPPGSSG